MAAVHVCDVDELFRLYTLPPAELCKHHLIVDVRSAKAFSRGHLALAFCCRVASSTRVLLDHSKAEYNTKWSDRVWEGRHVYVYGDPGLTKSHAVIDFLASGSCASLHYLKEGLPAIEAAYPSLITTSIKANCFKQYPSQIIAGLLYLGDWSHAEASERLQELGVRHVVTIHNNPENLKPKLGKAVRWLPWSLPDVETADIASCFNKTFEFIEEARAKGQAVLVHCGAGVSRSATLVMMYLMRRNAWNAQKAKEFTTERRPLVCINDGFWRTLCALEPALGICDRSDPDAGTGFRGVDAAPVAVLSDEAVGGRVPVQWQDASALKRAAQGGEQPSAKRARGEDGAAAAAATSGAGAAVGSKLGATVTLEVARPEGVVGQQTIGPIGPHQRVIYGRLPSNDVVVEHASISRQHVMLTFDAASGGVLLTDLKSGHGTQLDGSWIRPHTAKTLRVGSTFKLGASTRRYTVLSIEVHRQQ